MQHMAHGYTWTNYQKLPGHEAIAQAQGTGTETETGHVESTSSMPSWRGGEIARFVVTLKLPAERASADRANICWISSITLCVWKSRCRLDGQDSSLPCACLCLSSDQSVVAQALNEGSFFVGLLASGENERMPKRREKSVNDKIDYASLSVFLILCEWMDEWVSVKRERERESLGGERETERVLSKWAGWGV